MRKNTEAPVSSGATDSSVEAPVMGVERCGGVVRTESVRQLRKEEERARAVKPFGIGKRVVWEAWRHVRANRGAAGIDDESIAMFEANLKDNLYRVWNRMSSGSYFPPAVRLVAIPKKNGGVRTLGIPTVEDRIAQTVVKTYIEPSLEGLFHPDSYGYRPGKSALQALEVTTQRSLERNWVVEFDIQKAFDELVHTKVMSMVRMHIKERWAVMYIERWLKAPFVRADGTVVQRTKGVPQGSVIGPVLMRLWCGGRVASTRSSGGTKAAAICGFGAWPEDSRSCSHIGSLMAVLADGQSEPYDGRLSRTVVRPGKVDTFSGDDLPRQESGAS